MGARSSDGAGGGGFPVTTYALMGRKEEAIAQARPRCRIRTGEQGRASWAWPPGESGIGVCAHGRIDKAIALIERLLSTPGPIDGLGGPATITLANLRLGWLWDPLRQDPRFQKILAEPELKTIYN